MIDSSAATLTIDLAALASNWRFLQNRVAPGACAGVVKADAYGTGAIEVVPALARAGCTVFFVAHLSEGIEARRFLRNGNFKGKIYILNGGPMSAAAAQQFVDHDLQPVLNAPHELVFWRALTASGPLPAAALQFETGMNRLGYCDNEIASVVDATKGLAVDLVLSHFVASELPGDAHNHRQIAAFNKVLQAFPGICSSLANSSGIFLPYAPAYGLARPGYALYGGNPVPGQPNPMACVVHLDVPIIQCRWVPAGTGVGYNSQWRAKRRTRLATIMLGYADGFPRLAGHVDARPGHGATALVANRPCPFVGRTSMDLTILDVTGIDEAKVAPGIMASVLGPHATIDNLAQSAGVIGYEILTGLGIRFRRNYRY